MSIEYLLKVDDNNYVLVIRNWLNNTQEVKTRIITINICST